jgi:hypothetical protein
MGAPTSWDTSSDGAAAHSKPMELATLGEHKTLCSPDSGLWVSLRCGAGQLLSLVTARLVTTGALLAAGVAAWLMFR